MKKYTQEEIKELVKLHNAWIKNTNEGKRLVLNNADLSGANLRGADLSESNLNGANLRAAAPMFFCEFFQGMEVLQMRGNKSKESIFGIYWSGRLVGHCYFGEIYTVADLIKLVGTYMPPTIEELKEYDLKYGSDIWYCKFHPSQYAWIYDRVITLIEQK